MADRRESGRIKDISSRRILDDATRKRRQKRHLEALEKDNFQEDPHSHLTVVPAKMKVPAFNDTMEDKRKKRRSKTGELFKQRFRRTFAMLLEEAEQESEVGEPSYSSANVPPSKFPERHFCSVCGFPSNYTCVSCGASIIFPHSIASENTEDTLQHRYWLPHKITSEEQDQKFHTMTHHYPDLNSDFDWLKHIFSQLLLKKQYPDLGSEVSSV